jgi:arsenate reductase-like glutaredoxin family protein
MKNKAGIFFLKTILLSVPVLLLVGSYIYLDPWRVLFKYENYYKNSFVDLNRNYIGTEVYLKNKEKYKYNSFIFGNSRSRSFLCTDWIKYIPGASPMHYDANAETLLGILSKMKLIDKKGGSLDYALLIIDRSVLSSAEFNHGPVFEPHPAESKSSMVKFQATYLQYYLSDFFFLKYNEYYCTKKSKEYMHTMLYLDPLEYNPLTNDIYWTVYTNEMKKDPSAYVKKHHIVYAPRDTLKTLISEKCLQEPQIRLLSGIKEIFNKKQTKYKIMISPLYDQKYISPEDIVILDSIFGKENVYDFSGKNQYTRDIENYFESSHYRRRVALDIMSKMYAN